MLPRFEGWSAGLSVCAGSERISHLGLAVSLSPLQGFWVHHVSSAWEKTTPSISHEMLSIALVIYSELCYFNDAVTSWMGFQNSLKIPRRKRKANCKMSRGKGPHLQEKGNHSCSFCYYLVSWHNISRPVRARQLLILMWWWLCSSEHLRKEISKFTQNMKWCQHVSAVLFQGLGPSVQHSAFCAHLFFEGEKGTV